MKKAVSSRFLLPGIHCSGRDDCASATGIPYWWWKNLSRIRSGSSDWLTELLCCFSYCLRTTYRRHAWPQRSNVTTTYLLQNSQYSRKIFFFRRSIWILLELIRCRTQNFTIIYQEKQKIEQIYVWNPMINGFIHKHWFMSSVSISVAEAQMSLLEQHPQWWGVRRNGCFCRLS